MESKISMVINSHLSDIQIEIGLGMHDMVTKRIRFIKRLMLNNSNLEVYMPNSYYETVWMEVHLELIDPQLFR